MYDVHCTIAILVALRFIYRYLNMDCEIIIGFLGWLQKMHAASWEKFIAMHQNNSQHLRHKT